MELIYLGLFVLGVLTVVLALKFVYSRVEREELLPYAVKKFFFSRSEQEFLRLLNESIDRQNYIIFPKVRLADFIEVTATGKEYQGWWNKIRSKHVDFLVWNVLERKIVLAIELDGKSHQSERVTVSDAFKDKLYERLGLKMVRVAVGTNFTEEVAKIKAIL